MNNDKKVKGITKILAIMTSLIIGIAFMPVMAFATGYILAVGTLLSLTIQVTLIQATGYIRTLL